RPIRASCTGPTGSRRSARWPSATPTRATSSGRGIRSASDGGRRPLRRSGARRGARLRPARAARRLLRGPVSRLPAAAALGPRAPLPRRDLLPHALRRRPRRLRGPRDVELRQARGVRAEVRREPPLRAPHHERRLPRSARSHAHPKALRPGVHAEGAGGARAARPVQLIGDMLGVPQAERAPLRAWSLAILGALEPEPGPERLEAGSRAVEEFKDYLRRLIADRRRRPSTDPGEILSALLAAED